MINFQQFICRLSARILGINYVKVLNMIINFVLVEVIPLHLLMTKRKGSFWLNKFMSDKMYSQKLIITRLC